MKWSPLDYWCSQSAPPRSFRSQWNPRCQLRGWRVRPQHSEAMSQAPVALREEDELPGILHQLNPQKKRKGSLDSAVTLCHSTMPTSTVSGKFRGGRLNYCKTCKVNCSSKSLHLQWPSNKSQQVEGATRETMRLQISTRSHRIRSKCLPRWLSLSPWELDRMNQMLRRPGLPGKAGGKAPQQAEATPQHSNARDQHVPRRWRGKWGGTNGNLASPSEL